MTHALGGLAALLRDGAVDAHAAAARALRIASAVPNAVVHAASADDIAEKIAAIPPGAPFAGVPILIKDTAPEAGRPLTLGTRALAGFFPRDTDGFVAALSALGFVSVGRTATPEFGLSDTTEPLATGAVANPWGPGLSPGGSSGGAAAVVAAGAVPFAHGGDGGGSLRAPAARCGLVGLKPTRGALGQGPTPIEAWMPALGESFGLAPDVGSVAAVFAALRGEPAVAVPPSRRLRVAVIGAPLHGGAPDHAVAAALESAAALVASLGHQVAPASWPFDAPALHAAFFDLWALRTHLDLARFPIRFGRPLDRAILEGWTLGLDALGARIDAGQRARIDATLRAATAALLAMFAECDVLLTPVTRQPRLQLGAHRGDRDFPALRASIMDSVCQTPIHNIAGTPALALPLGAGPDGRPIGWDSSACQPRTAATSPAFSLALQRFPGASTVSDSAPPMPEPGTERLALLVYPGFTALDLFGPHHMLRGLLPRRLDLVARTMEPVVTDSGVTVSPSATFEEIAPGLDVLFVPGGTRGTLAAMRDTPTLDFLVRHGEDARYVTSVCTGSLVLGAAGLLRGYRATSHWVTRDLLPAFGAEAVDARVVIDGNRVTGAGVSAGLDLGLTLVGLLRDPAYAQRMQLVAEYDPQPPYDAGVPSKAPAAITVAMRAMFAPFVEQARAMAGAAF